MTSLDERLRRGADEDHIDLERLRSLTSSEAGLSTLLGIVSKANADRRQAADEILRLRNIAEEARLRLAVGSENRRSEAIRILRTACLPHEQEDANGPG